MKMALVSPAQLLPNGEPLHVKKSFLIPLSVYLIAGMTPRDWEIEVRNDYTDTIDHDAAYDLVAITATTLHAKRGYDIADEFRSRGKKVVFGGFHATLFPEEVAGHADAVVCGEAELVWKNVLDDAARGDLAPLYKADRLCDMQDQPVPRFDLINQKKYVNDLIPIESTRGCPFDCDYCSVSQFYGAKYRHRPVEQVVRDLKACGSRFINFVDDNIAGKISYSVELFEAITPLKIFWTSQMSMRIADDEKVLAAAWRSGLRYAILGIESLDEANLADVGKKKVNRVEEYVEKTKLFKKYGITVCSNLMFGFDHDTEETFERAYRFVTDNRFLPNPYIITPYPGTRLFDRWEKDGRILHRDFWKYTSYRTVFRPRNFSPERLDELFLNLYQRLFSLPNIFTRFFHMLRARDPWGSFMTQLAIAVNCLIVRHNLGKGKMPYY